MASIRYTTFAILFGLVAATPLAAQSGSVAGTPQVLILGTYHFESSRQNVAKPEVVDVLTPARQAEIREVLEALARFQPTKIAIESPSTSGAHVDSLYQAYRSGRRDLTRSESQQLGFRLAGTLGHDAVHPIDFRNDFPFGAMMEYAQVHDPEFVTFVQEELSRVEAESNRQQRDHTVGEILRIRNEPGTLAKDHGTYMRFAVVGDSESYVGADLVASWYERNLKIFANLKRIVEPRDRILVIFGSGHAPILRQLVTAHPEMILVDALEYLPPESTQSKGGPE